MTIFALIAILVIAAPIAKAIGERIARDGRQPRADPELRREIELLHSQLADTQNRLAATETRLDFYEKLLEERRPASLPPPKPPQDKG